MRQTERKLRPQEYVKLICNTFISCLRIKRKTFQRFQILHPLFLYNPSNSRFDLISVFFSSPAHLITVIHRTFIRILQLHNPSSWQSRLITRILFKPHGPLRAIKWKYAISAPPKQLFSLTRRRHDFEFTSSFRIPFVLAVESRSLPSPITWSIRNANGIVLGGKGSNGTPGHFNAAPVIGLFTGAIFGENDWRYSSSYPFGWLWRWLFPDLCLIYERFRKCAS